MTQTVYQERKRKRLCGRCGKRPPVRERAVCKKCLDDNKKRSLQRTKQLILTGMCTRCGKTSSLKNKRMCQKCANIHNLQTEQYQKNKIKRGLCSLCGKSPLYSKRFCRGCLNKEKYRRQQRINNKRCSVCGHITLENKTKCKQCLDNGNKRTRKSRKNKINNQICLMCSNPTINKKTLCINCSIVNNLRGRIREILKKENIKKSNQTFNLVGCSLEQLKHRLEKQFAEGMSWENYGEWHIDHIKPLSLFNLIKEEEQRKAFHYTNLQPLWARDNLSKGNKCCENKSKNLLE